MNVFMKVSVGCMLVGIMLLSMSACRKLTEEEIQARR